MCFTWAFPSDHTWDMEPGEALLFGVTTVLFCYAFKIYDWRIYFYFYAFPHLPSLSQVGDLNVSVCLSLAALPNGREGAHSPFTKGLLTQEESAGMGEVLRDWQPPSSPSHSVWCPGGRAVQTFPCQHFSLQPSQGLLPLGCIQFLWVRHRERKIKPLSAAKPSLVNTEVKPMWFGENPAVHLWKRWELDPALFWLGQ